MKAFLSLLLLCSLMLSFSVYAADDKTADSPLSAQIKTYHIKISTKYLSHKVASLTVGLQFSANPAPSNCSSPLIGMCPVGLSYSPMVGENTYPCTASSGDYCTITVSKGFEMTLIEDYWPGNKNFSTYNFTGSLTLNQMDSSGNSITSPAYQSFTCLPASGTFDAGSTELTVLIAPNGTCVISID